MTDLDWLPATDTVPVIETPRRHRHVWEPKTNDDGSGIATWHYECATCFRVRDETRARCGKSSRRLGGDQERRIEKVYGPVKIGERGDPVDHIGRVWKWQSKATRALPPLWLAAIDKPTPHPVTAAIATAWNRMTGLYGPRRSVVIRSFVSRGIRTRDWLFLDAHDGVAEFGYDTLPYVTGWWVIPGDWWLDHFGRDDPTKGAAG